MRVQIDIKGKVNRNELCGEKNRGPAYVPRFVTPFLVVVLTSLIHLTSYSSYLLILSDREDKSCYYNLNYRR